MTSTASRDIASGLDEASALEGLVALGRHRWAGPLLADLAENQGARFVELQHRLGIARDSLARTLTAALEQGWIARNPGHGHPLRPEYILAPRGILLASRASRIVAAQQQLGLPAASLTRWSMPLIRVIDQGHTRFNALARRLSPATPRALSASLRGLAQHHLIHRDLIDGYPPTSLYGLTTKGAILARAASQTS